MKVKIEDPEESISDFLARVLRVEAMENNKEDASRDEVNQKNEKNSIDTFKIRQLEQKVELLTTLCRLLFKKFEEIHPSQKFSKFEFTDLSWYSKLDTK
ncbi:MAG: hypothetical protein OEM79_03170 [Nitrosopumilus sp.]|nr:hypothetical protein [Nitrosopumilus sp.]